MPKSPELEKEASLHNAATSQDCRLFAGNQKMDQRRHDCRRGKLKLALHVLGFLGRASLSPGLAPNVRMNVHWKSMERAARVIGKLRVADDESLARAAWPVAVGKRIAGRSTAVTLAGSRLVVQVEDSVWQSQLYAMRGQILTRIEQTLGRKLVQSLEFKVAIPRPKPQREQSFGLTLDDADSHRQPRTAQHLQGLAPESRLLDDAARLEHRKGSRLKITEEQVRYVAELANLRLTEDEVARMQKDLDEILTHVDKLNELDTNNVQPMSQVLYEQEEGSTLRDDVEQPPLSNEVALANAPLSGNGYFKVPKVIER